MKNILLVISFILFCLLFIQSCNKIPNKKCVYFFYDLKIENNNEAGVKNQIMNIAELFLNNSNSNEDIMKLIPIQKQGGNIENTIYSYGDKKNKIDSLKMFLGNVKFIKPDNCDIFFILDYINRNIEDFKVDYYIVFLSDMINVNSCYDFNPSKCEQEVLDNGLKTFKTAKNDYDNLLNKYMINKNISKLYIINVSSGSSNINCSQSEINDYWKGFFPKLDKKNCLINIIPDFKENK